jgi:hypothetical protein
MQQYSKDDCFGVDIPTRGASNKTTDATSNSSHDVSNDSDSNTHLYNAAASINTFIYFGKSSEAYIYAYPNFFYTPIISKAEEGHIEHGQYQQWQSIYRSNSSLCHNRKRGRLAWLLSRNGSQLGTNSTEFCPYYLDIRSNDAAFD